MILGFHVIFGAYGVWLPNDPRGSWSDFVGAWELVRFGRATTTDTTHSVARQRHDQALRLAAKEALKYPPVQFAGIQARAVGQGFLKSAQKGKVTVWACAILPEHVHLVIAKHKTKVERITSFFKGAATRALIDEGIHPLAAFASEEEGVPKCWARGLWKVFLNSVEDVDRAIRYVEANPLMEDKPLQRWSVVTPFDPTTV